MLNRLFVLAQRLAQDARVAQGFGGVFGLRKSTDHLLVKHRRAIVGGDAFLDVGGREQCVRRLGGLRVLVGQLFVGGHGLVRLLAALEDRRGVVQSLWGLGIFRVFMGDPEEESRGLVVLSFGGVLLARFHHRHDDQAIQPILFRFGRERLGLLQTSRPLFDVLVVFGLGKRLQDSIARGTRRSDRRDGPSTIRPKRLTASS